MSGSKNITLRIQSSEGTFRVEVPPDTAASALHERVRAALRLRSAGFELCRDRACREPLAASNPAAPLRHGDMLYLHPVNGALLFDHSDGAQNDKQQTNESTEIKNTNTSIKSTMPQLPQEDEVDQLLYRMDGKIQRQRDEKLCRHSSRGRCVHCAPLEPWDEAYLSAHNIKHMSFHAYLRKLSAGKGLLLLQEPSCTIKPGCKEHEPWPRGICSACAPAAVTLARQPYRHVDNVVMARADIVERFLGYWRASGHQRLGLLYGAYEPHDAVPLGVRARVHAVWEPPQRSGRDMLAPAAPLEDLEEPEIRELAAELGLRAVGWIFTDLLPDDVAAGTVKCTRGVDTHFLSAGECVTAAHLQALRGRACRLAPNGTFGSKFVTVCVTGDSSKQVHLEGYQVSEQCVALARAGVLVPTRDAPELGYVREASARRYVPDVHYTRRDAYGNDVTVPARRLPVAYLLVDVPCGVAAPSSPAPAWTPQFPPANRALGGQLQTPRALHEHLAAAPSFLEAVSDLHVLAYLARNEALPLGVHGVRGLCAAVRARDAAAAAAWRSACPHWPTLERLCAAAADETPAPLIAPASAAPWTCALCTFHNAPHAPACEMCAMPRPDAP